MIGGDVSLYLKCLFKPSKWLRWSEIADFRSIFARSALAVTTSEKSSINTNRSPLRTFRWAQDEHRTFILSPQRRGGAQKRSVQTSKRYEIGCQLLLIINWKSHTGFRLIAISMTLNDLERRSSPYFAFFTELDCFADQLRHSGWRQTYNARKYFLPVPVFHFWP